MQQNPQIIPVDTEVTAYFVLVPLLEENLAQQTPVALGKLFQYFPNFLFRLFGGEDAEQIHSFGRNIRLLLIIQRIEAGPRSIMFKQDVVTNGIHERAQTLGLQDSSIAQSHKKSSESFLTDILDGFR